MVAGVLGGIVGGGCVEPAAEVTPGSGTSPSTQTTTTTSSDAPAATGEPGGGTEVSTTGASDSQGSGPDTSSTSAAQSTDAFGSSTSEGAVGNTSSGTGEGSDETGGSTGSLASCDQLYGDALDYLLCSQEPDRCHFSVTTDGASCEALCAQHGGTCLQAFDNPNDPGTECNVLGEDTCQTQRSTEICVCTRF